MDFLSWLIAVAITHWFSQDEVILIHKNYCENLYFQPNSLEKMLQYECDIEAVDTEVARVKSGRY